MYDGGPLPQPEPVGPLGLGVLGGEQRGVDAVVDELEVPEVGRLASNPLPDVLADGDDRIPLGAAQQVLADELAPHFVDREKRRQALATKLCERQAILRQEMVEVVRVHEMTAVPLDEGAIVFADLGLERGPDSFGREPPLLLALADHLRVEELVPADIDALDLLVVRPALERSHEGVHLVALPDQLGAEIEQMRLHASCGGMECVVRHADVHASRSLSSRGCGRPPRGRHGSDLSRVRVGRSERRPQLLRT